MDKWIHRRATLVTCLAAMTFSMATGSYYAFQATIVGVIIAWTIMLMAMVPYAVIITDEKRSQWEKWLSGSNIQTGVCGKTNFLFLDRRVNIDAHQSKGFDCFEPIFLSRLSKRWGPTPIACAPFQGG